MASVSQRPPQPDYLSVEINRATIVDGYQAPAPNKSIALLVCRSDSVASTIRAGPDNSATKAAPNINIWLTSVVGTLQTLSAFAQNVCNEGAKQKSMSSFATAHPYTY